MFELLAGRGLFSIYFQKECNKVTAATCIVRWLAKSKNMYGVNFVGIGLETIKDTEVQVTVVSNRREPKKERKCENEH